MRLLFTPYSERGAGWQRVQLVRQPVLFRLVVLLWGVASGCPGSQPSPSAEEIAANNRGVGLMGRFEYDAARQVFAQLVARRPDWLDVQVNLAIATLNRQQSGDDTTALEMLQGVLETDPNHLRAQYCSGLLLFHVGRTEEALDYFRAVTEADPADAYAAYFLAQGLAQLAQLDEAVEWYTRAISTDPYLQSAYYGAFQAYQQLGQTDKARQALGLFQRLQGNPQARLAEMKYTRMGPKALALAIDGPAARPPERPQGALFAAAQDLPVSPAGVSWQTPTPQTSITASDLNADGQIDVFITSAFAASETNRTTRNAVLLAESAESADSNGFSLVTDHPLAAVPGVNTAAWGDFDNDGLTDVYLCRRGENQLWRRQPNGDWANVTQTTQTAGGEHDSRDCVFLDADHDGDLDLFVVNADGPNELFNNNLDGSFRPLAAERGLTGGLRSSRRILPADLDGDRDVDLIVLHAEPPHQVFVNDRLWQYRSADDFAMFRKAGLVAAVVADVDANGRPEIYALETHGPNRTLQRWQADQAGVWQVHQLARLPDVSPAAQLAILDITGDGRAEAVVSTQTAWAVYRLAETQAELVFSADHPEACPVWTPLINTATTGPAIVSVCGDRGPVWWPAGPGRYPFASVVVSGRHAAQQTLRSNASGIGTRLAARFGSHWTVVNTFRNHSGPGQSLQPLGLGAAGAGQFDFVAIDWSDGVFQSELDVAVAERHTIVETQRQLSSCPIVFAWDGEQFRFVSDILGVGGLGYAIGPGEYAPVRPWENFLLPSGLLRPKDGRYQLKILQPMEEVCYLDAARLVAYDVPPGWGIVLDERMQVNGPAPSGQALFFSKQVLPAAAYNERGEEVSQRVQTVDRHAAPPARPDRRFIGRLQEEHILTLHFSESLDAFAGQPWLVADGWIEYPYSQTMFAAWQAGADYRAPTLEVQGADGQWQVLAEQFGYPAGMPRRMAFPLGPLPAAARALRLRTNQEIYWDRLAVVFAEPCPQVRKTQLSLQIAQLARVGFPQRTTGNQRLPQYAYPKRQPFDDMRFLPGWYTQFGRVTELLSVRDDALAVFGPGEAVHLEFSGSLSSPAPGWRRHFVLESAGWAKDMDLYTRDGETVAPLPTSGHPTQPRDQLHTRYLTRYQAGFAQ